MVSSPTGESQSLPLISICLCTYRRAAELEQLLKQLDQQVTNGLFDISIVVIDNDSNETARGTVEAWAPQARVPIRYGVEPQQGIALARNASVALARGQLLAFID